MSDITPLISLTLIGFLLILIYLQWRKIASMGTARRTKDSGEASSIQNIDGEVDGDVNATALFTTLSHELRTPLHGLLGIVQMLNEKKEDEDLRAIEGCARHMLAVISSLANHSKIRLEWDDLPEYREWVNMFELMEQIKRHISFRAKLRGLNVKLIHQDKSSRFRVDTDHLRGIVENAILGSLEAVSLVDIPANLEQLTIRWESNEGEVKIYIDNPLENYSDDRRRLIRTAGGLISDERLSRIKMEYLYWSVASMLLEKYSGVMLAKPEGDGVHTLLSFELEQMQATTSDKLPVGGLSYEAKDVTVKSIHSLPMKLSILVAEDDPISRSLMSTILKHMGQETQFATNGREVLDLVSQSKSYDVILMDIDMPIMDGLSASIALRNGEAGEFGTQVPIVAVTAFNTLSDESRFKKAGMNYFLPKPVRLRHLREVLLEVVRSE